MMYQLDLFGEGRRYIQPAPRHIPELPDDDIPFADTCDWQLTDEQRAAIAERARNWLAIGQPIKLIGGTPRLIGRKGRVHRVCKVFITNCYVRLPRAGWEHDAKTIMVELRHIEPLGA